MVEICKVSQHSHVTYLILKFSIFCGWKHMHKIPRRLRNTDLDGENIVSSRSKLYMSGKLEAFYVTRSQYTRLLVK